MRDERGRFTTGNSGGGRPKGSRNKKTEIIRDAVIDFVQKNIGTLQSDFEKLKPDQKFRHLIELMKFTTPVLKSVNEGDILERLTDEDFERLVERLKNQQNKY